MEGMPPDSTAGTPKQPPRRGGFWMLLIAFLLINWVLMSFVLGPPERTDVSYTFFSEQLDDGNVETVTSTADTIQGDFKESVDYPPGVGGRRRGRPVHDAASVVRDRRPARDAGGRGRHRQRHLPGRAPAAVAADPRRLRPDPAARRAALWFLRRRSAGLGGLGGFGKSQAALYQPDAGPRTTFADVAGIDEVEHEVREIVDFLRDPQRYTRLGARIPRGVLLSGPPGTGKTLLARAVAGEAGVPFFSISASEFIEAIVGVGASRVRDLFDQAKKVAPSIIFIDELDAIGRARGGAFSAGGVDEREQTLNQILTEMDGFQGNEGVVVLAATNRPEILDPALLRPGRFDRRVSVSPPDLNGRLKILQVHTRARAAGAGRRPRRGGRRDAGHGGRGPGQPRQRGGAAAAARAPPRTGHRRRLRRRRSRRSCWAPRAASCSRPRRSSAPRTTSRVTPCSAC